MEKLVTIIQRRLTDYRVPLFQQLRQKLASEDIHLNVLHGHARSFELKKNDAGHIEWAGTLKTRYFFGEKLCWQPFLSQTRNSDLVIITQENNLISNHFALFAPRRGKLAFWGHGGNFQGDAKSLVERYKRRTSSMVDHYFAYTEMSAKIVLESGLSADRITVLNNAIDIADLRRLIDGVSPSDIQSFKVRNGLAKGPVGVYIGSLYEQKKIDFLLNAAERIRQRISDFNLIICGDGPDRAIVQQAAARREWIKYLGKVEGVEKATVLKLGNVMLNPGLVGLGVLDSFAAAIPMCTTDCGLHSPEIAYLSNKNGVMSEDNIASYVEACADLLSDVDRMSKLREGCRDSASQITLENMVKNFASGIISALGR